ncbi:MAG: thiamine-phosphate kinase [Burkholderiaceae bacterium]
MLSEFELIKSFFIRPSAPNDRVDLGIGDDCALLAPGPGLRLAISTDMLVEGQHFFAGTAARSLGHKALAVNLSDLAAMGARPVAFTLALALPVADPDWLRDFSIGLFALADQQACTLIGGDTTRGPLTICITVFGEIPVPVPIGPGSQTEDHAAGLDPCAAQGISATMLRSAALPGDDLWISGTLGDARLALGAMRHEHVQYDVGASPSIYQESSAGLLVLGDRQLAQASLRLHEPTPRVALGIALRGIAHAAIDISDGFAGDLGHVLAASRCGATVNVDALPAGPVLAMQSTMLRRTWTLAGGDDYELCFTAPPHRRASIVAAAKRTGTPVARVGRIDAEIGLRLIDASGAPLVQESGSFDHFRTA